MTTPLRSRPGRHLTIWCAVIGALITIGCGLGSDSSSDSDGADTGNEAQPEGQASATAPSDWFEAVTYTGSGDDVVELPDGVEAGIVTASHDGSHAFSLNMLDDNNETTFDAMVITIGSYQGSHAFGLESLGNAPTKIEITADGNWEITVAHLSTAPVLELPVTGEGDQVFQYETAATEWALSFDGDSAFTIDLSGEAFGGVFEMGPYEGTITLEAGEGILAVTGEGSWTISEA